MCFDILNAESLILVRSELHKGITPSNGMIVLPDDEIEPTCISDVDDERFRVQLWKMKELLEAQLKQERFWETNEDFLLEIGICIWELMFAKFQIMSEHDYEDML